MVLDLILGAWSSAIDIKRWMVSGFNAACLSWLVATSYGNTQDMNKKLIMNYCGHAIFLPYEPQPLGLQGRKIV